MEDDPEAESEAEDPDAAAKFGLATIETWADT